LNNVTKVLEKFGERVTKLARINIGATRNVDGKRRKIDSSGELRKSIEHNTKKTEVGYKFDISMEHYGTYVDQGRKPGKGIPIAAMQRWIQKKPIRLRDLETNQFIQATPKKLESLGFLLNRKIKKEGIKKTEFLSKPFKKEFKKLKDDILEAFGKDLEEELINDKTNKN